MKASCSLLRGIQEEPANMGALSFVLPKLHRLISGTISPFMKYRYCVPQRPKALHVCRTRKLRIYSGLQFNPGAAEDGLADQQLVLDLQSVCARLERDAGAVLEK
ncbi:MAG: hypothetical protein ABJC09_11910 [Terriglobia bacterium]